MILDSGTRKEFESGAVRDLQEGKGRCDLLPLNVSAQMLHSDEILMCLHSFICTGNAFKLYDALHKFSYARYGNIPTALLEVSVHFEEGAKKYKERNWEKGLPIQGYINSAVRHYLKNLRGDSDERHDRAFVWNLMCALWTLAKENETP